MKNSEILELHQEIKDSVVKKIDNLNKEIKSYSFDEDIKKDIEKLRNYGFENFDFSRMLRDYEYKIFWEDYLKHLTKIFKGYTLITEETINKICKKFDLKFDYVKNYTAEVPFETISKIKEFYKFTKKNSLNTDDSLEIIAPKEKFDKNSKNFKREEDPILVSKVDYRGVYVVIHSWGYEKELLRDLK
jgi:hypothetical protein